MALPPHLPDHGSVLAEVRKVRRAGVVRLRGLDTPELIRIARELPGQQGELASRSVEVLLRTAVAGLGGGTLQTAAEYSLGLAQGTRDWPAADRRRRAAEVYGVSVERFRKHHELMVLGQLTEQVLGIAGAPAAPAREVPATGRPVALPAAHRVLKPYVHGRPVSVTVHVHSVDLLRDVDVVVSPSNTYFALPAAYKSSVAATLRRAGAHKDPTGDSSRTASMTSCGDGPSGTVRRAGRPCPARSPPPPPEPSPHRASGGSTTWPSPCRASAPTTTTCSPPTSPAVSPGSSPSSPRSPAASTRP
nr:hypothetical protein [Streptomyces avermitilis]